MMQKVVLIIFVLLALSQAVKEDDLVSRAELAKFKIVITEDLYSGYLPVNDDGSAQFHYFFVLRDDKLPVTLWLNGGPGCSSAEGLFLENGPTNFLYNSATIENNKFGWSTVTNMLYLESPIGVGFSYGPDGEQTDDGTANYNLKALVSFFKLFPQFQGKDFFMAGESYAGIYIPTLSSKIIDYNQDSKKQFAIGLKGILIGNGCTDPTECTDQAELYPQHVYAFYGGHNLISQSTYKRAMDNVQSCFNVSPQPQKCVDINIQVVKELQSFSLNFNPYNVYGNCPNPTTIKRDRLTTGSSNDGEVPPCADVKGLFTLLRDPAFMTLLHINTAKTPNPWNICTGINYTQDPRASYYLYAKLIKSGLRIWKMSGDIDANVPITGTLYWLHKLQNEYNLRTIVNWRAWYAAGTADTRRQNAGNFWKLDGVTFVSVRDSGHQIPTDQRALALDLFTAFINNKDLPAL